MKLVALVALVALGCAGGTSSRSGPHEVSEHDAWEIAEDRARIAGYDPEVFVLRSTEYSAETGDWALFFEHVPPAPPGGHFTVYIDRSSGDARLVPGR
jgi:hypothetical protein